MDSGNDEQFPTSQSQFLFSVSSVTYLQEKACERKMRNEKKNYGSDVHLRYGASSRNGSATEARSNAQRVIMALAEAATRAAIAAGSVAARSAQPPSQQWRWGATSRSENPEEPRYVQWR